MTTYYVRTDGHDEATGLNDTNNASTGAWLTLQNAADSVSAGDTVIVKPGTYYVDDDRVISITKSGSDGSPITFQSSTPAIYDMGGSDHAIISNYPNTAAGPTTVSITGSWWVLDGFEIKGGNVNFAGSNIIIKRNYLHHIGNWLDHVGGGHSGIGSSGLTLTNWTIDSNIFQDVGRYGAAALGDYSNPDPPPNNFQANDHCIYAGWNGGTICNNIFYVVDMPGTKQHGCHIEFSCTGASNYGQNTKIVNNTFYGLHDYSNAVQIVDPNGLSGFVFANNLEVDASLGSSGDDDYYGGTITFSEYQDQNNADGAVVRNNITNYGSIVNPQSGYTGTVTYTNNTVSYAGNPFVNKSSRDFHLVADSTPIGAAYAADLPTHDFDGVTRPQGSAGDVGIYEYLSTGQIAALHNFYRQLRG